MARRGKNYREADKLLDRESEYDPQEAIELAKKMAHAKFDETVELHLRMGVDPRNAEQQVRGVALMPHGLGKQVRILVFAQGEAVRIAENSPFQGRFLFLAVRQEAACRNGNVQVY